MTKPNTGSRDPALNSFLSRVEQLDIERLKKKPAVKPKPRKLRYEEQDLKRAEELLNGTFRNPDSYEKSNDRVVSSLAYKSAYNFDKTFSPKKNNQRPEFHQSKKEIKSILRADRDGSTHEHLSRFDDVYHRTEPKKSEEYVVSKDDYELLMKVKKEMAFSQGDYPTRGSPRNSSIHEKTNFKDSKTPGSRKSSSTFHKFDEDPMPPPLFKRPDKGNDYTPKKSQNKIIFNKLNPSPRNGNEEQRHTSPVRSKATYKIVDEPIDEFSEVFQKVQLTSKNHSSLKSDSSSTSGRKVPPNPPPKRSELNLPKLRPSKPLDSVELKEQKLEAGILVRKMNLQKPNLPPTRRDITPEALKAKSKLTKPVVPPKHKANIPEAMLQRSNLNKPVIPPKPSLDIPEALLKKDTLRKTRKNSKPTSEPFPEALEKTLQLQNRLKNKMKSGLQNSSSSSSLIPLPDKNSSTDSLQLRKSNSLTKTRSRGPKRKLPSTVPKAQ